MSFLWTLSIKMLLKLLSGVVQTLAKELELEWDDIF